jgi:hypothetical protein
MSTALENVFIAVKRINSMSHTQEEDKYSLMPKDDLISFLRDWKALAKSKTTELEAAQQRIEELQRQKADLVTVYNTINIDGVIYLPYMVIELQRQNAELLEALTSIIQYGRDTLTGPSRGAVDDRGWQREAVVMMTQRAINALNGRPWYLNADGKRIDNDTQQAIAGEGK